jgi:transcriptional regulator GlxA family with amidase domain
MHRASQTPYIAAAIVQGSGHAVIERARRWLNVRIDQEWNMAELAAYCNTSPRTLSRRFQKAVGLSPIQYTRQLRVERVKALLETTTLSLEDITARCGYANVSTFSTVFKRWAQITPREYRGRFGLRIQSAHAGLPCRKGRPGKVLCFSSLNGHDTSQDKKGPAAA